MTPKMRAVLTPENEKHKVDWLLDTAKGQALLSRLHPHQKLSRLRCACTKHPEMVIRHRDGRFHIARMPDSGHLHASGECDFYTSNPADGGGGEYEGAIRHHDDFIEIKINFPLAIAMPAEHQEPSRTADPDTGRVKRGSMGLAGLLSQLWSEAGLNVWSNEIRPWIRVYSSLLEVAKSTCLGKRKMADYLYVQPDEKREWLPKTPDDASTCRDYSLVLFKVSFASPAPDAGAYLKSSAGGNLLAEKDVLHALQHRFLRVWPFVPESGKTITTPSDKKPKVVCLALAHWKTIDGAPQLVIRDAALMLTNWRDIPVESSHELEIADRLVEKGRRFTKPMRFDAAADVVFPDFVLNDTDGQDVPMEVFGITGNDKYDARKKAKREYYAANGIKFWEWTPGQAIQDFPT